MTVWVTSDTHFFHDKICELDNRPFDSLEDMHEALIENWNSIVLAGDLVYHLGDFAMSWGPKDSEKIDKLIRSLKGNKILIRGNHDRKEVYRNERWARVERYHEIRFHYAGESRKVVLCHYPLRSWSGQGRGSWMLHGHCHGNLTDRGGKILDVGTNSWSYFPVTLEEIGAQMEARDITWDDHHSPHRDE